MGNRKGDTESLALSQETCNIKSDDTFILMRGHDRLFYTGIPKTVGTQSLSGHCHENHWWEPFSHWYLTKKRPYHRLTARHSRANVQIQARVVPQATVRRHTRVKGTVTSRCFRPMASKSSRSTDQIGLAAADVAKATPPIKVDPRVKTIFQSV